MRILSLFDGISCGRLALERAGIPVEKYYASEIDKYAIQVTQKNRPDTIQVGDVTKLNYLELLDVDMVIGGSPCQDLSIAKQNREGLRGVRSGLFWKYVEALETIKPKRFLLENVASMKDEDRDAITETLRKIYPETECIMINSALVSAQQRKRYYWTNWHVEQPQDKGILLKDILESGYADREKSLCISRRYAGFAGTQSYLCRRYFGKSFGQAVFSSNIDRDFIKLKYQENKYFDDKGLSQMIRSLSCEECEKLQTLPTNYTSCIKSENKRKEAIGNGWTVDVIAWIFSQMPKE